MAAQAKERALAVSLPASTKRVQFEFYEEAMQRLEDLKIWTEASSNAEVVKNSLKLYAALFQLFKAGNTLHLRTRKGKQGT